MDTNGRISINIPRVVHETIDGETVILNLDNGNYYSLVGTGAHIWDYVEKGATVNDIIERLYCDYEAGKEDIEREVNKFLSELMKEDLTTSDGAHTSHVFKTSDDQVETATNGKKNYFTPPVLNKYTDMQDLLLLDPIHEVDDKSGWPNVDDKKGWPTRNPDVPKDN
jgi:hypothetical protein